MDNVPISESDTEIEHALLKTVCELRSSVKMERARDADQKLTRCVTGRRFVFISVPNQPPEKKTCRSVCSKPKSTTKNKN